MEYFNIFGIKINLADYDSLVKTFLSEKKTTFGCVNQYYLNLAYEDHRYRDLLNKLEIVHVDGIGIYLAILFISRFRTTPPRVTGSDFYLLLLGQIELKKLRLYILGDTSEVLNKAQKKILVQYPTINIVGVHHGFIDNDDYRIVENIKSKNPDVIFVGLGSKKQEQWINKWHNEFPEGKIIAIGGGLRAIGGDRNRGNKLFQKMGLEWFVRLITEPKKVWKRYLLGIPLFILRVAKEGLRLDAK